ncbi:MAG: trigger factor [Proteobacteria bacterium]|nr:trigger factor [Pseudomonadota bacterium]
MSDLSVTTTEESPVLRKLEAEVDVRRVRKAFDKAYRELGRSVRVKGFRPGKAPRAVLEKLYGASMVEEIERTLVSESLPEAVEQSGIEPVAEPSIDAAAPSSDEAFRYTAEIQVKPAIELPELGGLPAMRPVVLVDDTAVDDELEGLRQRRAPMVDDEEGATAAEGHHVSLDYAGRIDGELFEGGSAENAIVEIGSGRFIPGFEEQLVGATAGEERQLTVAFPDDYPAEDLAGKEAVFDVKVHALQRRQVPDLDDAFAKELGLEGVETLEELREKIRTDLTERQENAAKEALHRSVMDSLIERAEFEVPPGLIDRRLQQRLEMAHQQLGQMLPHEELHQRLAQWQEEWRPDAERDVREALLLEAVAREKEFDASDEEVDAKIEDLAREQGMAVPRLRKAYEERGMIDSLRQRLAEEKALEFLAAEAKVEETTGT